MKRLDIKILGIVILMLGGQVFTSPCGYALTSVHPLEMYDQGIHLLDSYRGDPSVLYEAQQIFSSLMKKFPDSPYGYLGMSRVQRINAYLYDNRYRMEKVRDEVLPFAIKALELGPSIREVHENYSMLETIYEDFYANQKEAQEALISFPERAETYLLIGQFFGDQDESEKAIEFYKATLGLEPSPVVRLQTLQRIGLLYLEQTKEPEKAVKYFQEAVEIAPDSAVINENLGAAYLKMKNYPQAVDRLQKAMNSLKNSCTEHYLFQARALLAEERGNFKDAINFLELALSQNTADINLHFKLGNLYYNMANYENAYVHFMRVINLEPQNPGAYYFAGRSAYSLGKTDTAIDYYKTYLKLNADSEEAAWIRNNVPELSQNK